MRKTIIQHDAEKLVRSFVIFASGNKYNQTKESMFINEAWVLCREGGESQTIFSAVITQHLRLDHTASIRLHLSRKRVYMSAGQQQ